MGDDPLLVVSIIDVGNAIKGHVKNIQTYTDYGYEQLLLQDSQTAPIKLIERILKRLDVKGVVSLYGRQNASNVIHLSEGLKALGYDLRGEGSPTLLDTLRETKSPEEVDRIRSVGAKTVKVVKKTLEFLRECKIMNETLFSRGTMLKVGNVKKIIATLLAEENLMPIGDTIFAVGKNSADPHYSGTMDDIVMANQPIVFDIFPQDFDGYCFDCTRTFVIGKASREVEEMYEMTLEGQEQVLETLREGVLAKDVMNMICERFEKRGYKTLRNLMKGEVEAQLRGFIHSLGHGVGLSIGERPYLSLHANYMLRNGHVMTIEPGLYEPGLGGVRIEDVLAIQSNFKENLTPLEKVLEY